VAPVGGGVTVAVPVPCGACHCGRVWETAALPVAGVCTGCVAEATLFSSGVRADACERSSSGVDAAGAPAPAATAGSDEAAKTGATKAGGANDWPAVPMTSCWNGRPPRSPVNPRWSGPLRPS
jgi:hypothetical protein